MNRTHHFTIVRRKWLLLLLFGLLVVLLFAVLEITNTTHLFHKGPKVSVLSPPLQSLPAKPAANNGEKSPTVSSSVNQQTATDKKGQIPSNVTSDQSKWTTSQSGVITLKEPQSNSLFKSGDDLFGSSSLGQVQYRLIDNQVGVVSEGTVSVVNGNFTASVNFKSYSTSGRLDVFTTDANGKEFNEVQVPLNF